MDGTTKQTECLTCKSLKGDLALSPGPVIHEGKHWRVEHVAPTEIRGWLVIVLKRHVAALHELSVDDFLEFAVLCKVTTTLLLETLKCEKEYVACFAEQDGFRHIHAHVIPRPVGLSTTFLGPHIFQLLGPKAPNPLKDEEIRDICLDLRKRFKPVLQALDVPERYYGTDLGADRSRGPRPAA